MLSVLPVHCWKLDNCIIMSYFVIREGSGTVKKSVARNQVSDFCGYLASNGLRRKWLARASSSPAPLFLSPGLNMVCWTDGRQLMQRKTLSFVESSLRKQPLHTELLRRPEHVCLEEKKIFFSMVNCGAFRLFYFSCYLSNKYTHMQTHTHLYTPPTLVSFSGS